MSKLKPMSLGDVLKKQDFDHISLINQARQLRRLNRELRPILPESMRDHVGIANINNGNLSLYAHTPAWCYKLRLHSRPILKFLNQKDISIKKVSYCIVPLDQLNAIGTTRNLPKRPVNPRALDAIVENANKINDQELKEMLLKFVKNSARGQTDDGDATG